MLSFSHYLCIKHMIGKVLDHYCFKVTWALHTCNLYREGRTEFCILYLMFNRNPNPQFF